MPRGSGIRRRHARILLATLPSHVADREVGLLKNKTGWDDACFTVGRAQNSRGPGNVVMIEIEAEHVTEVFTGFGEIGRPAEVVATDALQACQHWLNADVPVGVYLADQLLLPLAIAGNGCYATLPLTRHSTTHIELVRRFLDVQVSEERLDGNRCMVRIG